MNSSEENSPPSLNKATQDNSEAFSSSKSPTVIPKSKIVLIFSIFVFGAIYILGYFLISKKDLVIQTTPIPTSTQTSTITQFEWEKIQSGMNTKDFGEQPKLGFIKLDQNALWLSNEDGTGKYKYQDDGFVSAAMSPNGKYLAFVKGTSQGELVGDLWVQKIIGVGPAEPTRLTDISIIPTEKVKGVTITSFKWSPDNQRIAFTVNFHPLSEGGESVVAQNEFPTGVIDGIYYVDLNKPSQEHLLFEGKIHTGGYFEEVPYIEGWTDPSHILFKKMFYDNEMSVIDVGEKTIQPFPVSNAGQFHWSNTGDKMVYYSYESKKIMLDERGSKIALATSTNKKDPRDENWDLRQGPVLSPDGRYVAYRRSYSGAEEIWVIDLQDKLNSQGRSIAAFEQYTIWRGLYWLSDSNTILYGFSAKPTEGFNVDLYTVSLTGDKKLIQDDAYMPMTISSNSL